MKILLLDIETAPNLAYVWGIWQQNIGINQIKDNGHVLCWAAKWLGDDKILFDSVKRSSEKSMLGKIHRLVSQADALVHYNGQKFDLPTLNREWLKHGFKPPAPSKHIDLMRVCKKHFRFVSNKLDYISQFLGLGEKTHHTGQQLWTDCMYGKAAAWKLMEQYNKQDVVLLESLYQELLPWISNHPSHAAREGYPCCPKCGSERMQQRGYAITSTYKYRRYQCKDCGGWHKGNHNVNPPAKERYTSVTM